MVAVRSCGAKLFEYASSSSYETPRGEQRGDHRSQALTVMWRRIFRTTLSAACELTVPNQRLMLHTPTMRVLYHNNTTCPDAHVRAPESLTIISLCTQRDLLEAVEKCRCTHNTSIETLQNDPIIIESFQFI